jgi:hypothetical protein
MGKKGKTPKSVETAAVGLVDEAGLQVHNFCSISQIHLVHPNSQTLRA